MRGRREPTLRSGRTDRRSIERKGWRVNDVSIDKAALAALRPGMPVSALRAICGASWERVKPDQSGWVVKLADIGFTARIDAKGLIGKLAFTGAFPSTIPVEGLFIGMSFDAALAVYPSLRHIGDITVSTMTLRRFGTTRADGIAIEARFRDSRLIALDLERSDAIYAAPPAAGQ
jgi:hypothetical protein